jgi:anti-anti-sigma factor
VSARDKYSAAVTDGQDMTPRLAIERDDSDEGLVLRLTGELDPHTAPILEEQIEEYDAGNRGRVVLDLGGITFVDSSGLRVLVVLDGRLRDDGRKLVIRAPSAAVSRVLKIAGLDDHLQID